MARKLDYSGVSDLLHLYCFEGGSQPLVVRKDCKEMVDNYSKAKDKDKEWENRIMPAIMEKENEYGELLEAIGILDSRNKITASDMLANIGQDIFNEIMVLKTLNQNRPIEYPKSDVPKHSFLKIIRSLFK